jgi:hypothetical protein
VAHSRAGAGKSEGLYRRGQRLYRRGQFPMFSWLCRKSYDTFGSLVIFGSSHETNVNAQVYAVSSSLFTAREIRHDTHALVVVEMLLVAASAAPPRHPRHPRSSSSFERPPPRACQLRRRRQPIAASSSSSQNKKASTPTTTTPPPKSPKEAKPSAKANKLTAEAEGLLAAIESHRATGHPVMLVAQTAPAVRVTLSEAGLYKLMNAVNS